MKTVGQILKEAREKKELSLEKVSRETKISVAYLEAIETNNFSALPAATFAKGLMQNYAKAIGLNPQTILAIFRRDYDLDERGNIILRGLTKPVRTRMNVFTPTSMALSSSIIVGLLVASFFIRQIFLLASAPDLEISIPLELGQVTSPVQVEGSTSSQAQVTINNQPVVVNSDGIFKTTMTLTQGEHTLVVTTTSRSGRSRTIQRHITVIN